MSSLVKKMSLAVFILYGVVSGWSPQASAQVHTSSVVPAQLIAQSWYELSPRERSEALKNYRRFQKLPPEKKRNLEERYNQWRQLPTEEKERLRRNYRRYRGMDSDEKEDFSRKYKRWRSRPHQ